MRLVRPNIASLRMPTHLLALLAMAVPIKEWADGIAKNDGGGMLILEDHGMMTVGRPTPKGDGWHCEGGQG